MASTACILVIGLPRPCNCDPRSPARTAVIRPLRPCRPTPAGSSTTAAAAARVSNPGRVTAACSVLTARSRVRRSRVAVAKCPKLHKVLSSNVECPEAGIRLSGNIGMREISARPRRKPRQRSLTLCRKERPPTRAARCKRLREVRENVADQDRRRSLSLLGRLSLLRHGECRSQRPARRTDEAFVGRR